MFSATLRHCSCMKDLVLTESVNWATDAALSATRDGG
jgi:hypothetical protein